MTSKESGMDATAWLILIGGIGLIIYVKIYLPNQEYIESGQLMWDIIKYIAGTIGIILIIWSLFLIGRKFWHRAQYRALRKAELENLRYQINQVVQNPPKDYKLYFNEIAPKLEKISQQLSQWSEGFLHDRANDLLTSLKYMRGKFNKKFEKEKQEAEELEKEEEERVTEEELAQLKQQQDDFLAEVNTLVKFMKSRGTNAIPARGWYSKEVIREAQSRVYTELAREKRREEIRAKARRFYEKHDKDERPDFWYALDEEEYEIWESARKKARKKDKSSEKRLDKALKEVS